MTPKQLSDLASWLFGKKEPLNNLHQEIATHFYFERADFTLKRSLGSDFSPDTLSSYPALCRRDLANQFTTMLRPTARPWFHVGEKFSDKDKPQDNEVGRYLEWFENTQRKAMYDPFGAFTRATKEADNDISAFGQSVLSVELDARENAFLYRTWHLRDVAWQETASGKIGCVFRKWKPPAIVLEATFPGKLHERINRIVEKTPFEEVEAMHMVVEAEMYDAPSQGRPRWSIWYDAENDHVIEATPIWNRHYIIPRWTQVASWSYGSQYALSPSVICGLPDARLIQAMTFTLLEAGEKAANPPMVATHDAVRSDLALYAGGVTWVEHDYDERLGDALRPITQDFRGHGLGLELAQDARSIIRKAFYLDSLQLPQAVQGMTAYEVGQRVQEWIRAALPLFEPLEVEYNAALCEETFEILMRGNAFGSPLDWPRKMRGMEFEFRFESPLHDVIEQQKGQKWLEAKTLIADAMALDQSNAYVLDSTQALRDALNAIRVPAKWLRSESEAMEMAQRAQEEKQQQQMLEALEQGSSAVANLAGAQKDVAQAQGSAA